MEKQASNKANLVAVLIVLLAANVGCKMLGGSSVKKSGADSTTAKGLPADQICLALAHPSFESNSGYNGEACSGSTSFGARDTRTASYETDLRPSFSYSAIGEGGVITKVNLNMSKRSDGAEFFAAEAETVAKMINGEPLPQELRSAILSPVPMGGSTTNVEIGNAKAELIRNAADNTFRLTFQF